MLIESPDAILESWLSDFENALSRRDLDMALELFHPDAYWRDLVALTWNIHTAEGSVAIYEMLQACLPAAAPRNWQLEGPVRANEGVLEAGLTFETEVAWGKGVLRLRDGRCWTLLTAASDLKGHEEVKGLEPSRAAARHGPEQATGPAFDEAHPPYCLVIGAGHCGLAIGARLQQLGVPTLLVEKHERPGDVWRNRYDSLHLHSPSFFDGMPYMRYPETWPLRPSKDQFADWLDAYRSLLGLEVWTRTECVKAEFDAAGDAWRVEIVRDGRAQTLRPRQLVLANGTIGPVKLPELPGMETFKGQQVHASAYRDALAHPGQRCVVVGSGTSAHDVAAALSTAGADVTMVQRSPTMVVRLDSLMPIFAGLYSQEAAAAGITVPQADLLMASMPHRLFAAMQVPVFAKIRETDAAFYASLERAGFLLDYDEVGLVPQIFRRASGYYIDVGASELIANGTIKLKAGAGIDAVNASGVVLTDGSHLPADLIVYATGYGSFNGHAAHILPADMIEKVGRVFGLGSGTRGDPGPWAGEMRNLWKPTQQRSLWFHSGGIAQSRFYSRLLALQIKARLEGIPTPVYALAPACHQ